MTNLNGQTLDILQENIGKLRELFPEVATEDKIDFDKLKQILGAYVDDSNERYNFSWNGKGKALRLSQTPSLGTLRPCKEESKDWDTTQNLYIEGDNLEVLKLLQKSYHNKVKIIYIDPPYNTGGDFVYPDDFSDSIENYKKITGQIDGEGGRISTNTESSGRYHTDWLNLIYPRLRLARNLLADDGIIFISIDDIEMKNLKSICDEIFGQENYIETIVWKNKYGAGAKTVGFISVHEYILCYGKSPISNITSEIGEEEQQKYSKKDEKYATRGGYMTQPLMTNSLGDRPNLMYPITYNGTEIFPNKQWVWARERLESEISKNNVEFNLQSDGTYSVRSKQYLYDENGIIRRGKPLSIMNGPFTQDGTKEMRLLFNDKSIFDFTKPSKLIQYFISLQISDNEDKAFTILDFFSGSATTAHAVMKLNAEDGGNRKFIMVQLPEPCAEDSEAFKAGYKNICEIGKERIRRAGDKIKEDTGLTAQNLDIGFKVLKLDTSNLKKWQPDYDNLEQTLMDSISNFIDGRSEMDVVYEIVLKMGLDLTYPIEKTAIGGKKVYSVGFGALMMCLDDEITTDVANGMVQLHKESQPETWKVVFKDNGFKSDSNKTNIKEILKCAGLDEDAFTTI